VHVVTQGGLQPVIRMPQSKVSELIIEDDDLSCIERYRAGDVAAFDAIFRKYHGRIRALCRRYVGDGQAAEDMVQETFYNVLKAIDRIDPDFNFSAWIHRIAVNLCHDELRRRDRAQTHVEQPGMAVEAAVLRVADDDRAGDPEQALELTHLRSVVWEVAKRLPERQRMVITLRELQGLSYASIATVMGISQSAVETLLHRARKRFKDEYLAVEGHAESADRGDCATAAYLLENTRHGNLRKDQRRMLAEHLLLCSACRRRFPERIATVLPNGLEPGHADAGTGTGSSARGSTGTLSTASA
jgi:RNA polymerase sigma-70 factor (ECF subfamily)